MIHDKDRGADYFRGEPVAAKELLPHSPHGMPLYLHGLSDALFYQSHDWGCAQPRVRPLSGDANRDDFDDLWLACERTDSLGRTMVDPIRVKPNVSAGSFDPASILDIERPFGELYGQPLVDVFDGYGSSDLALFRACRPISPRSG